MTHDQRRTTQGSSDGERGRMGEMVIQDESETGFQPQCGD